MTERIRSLLDGAVEDVTPRLSEPVPELMRRGEVARRRTRVLTAAATVAATVATIGGVMVAGAGRGAQAPGGNPSTGPVPTPIVEVTDDEVRVGGLVLPIPPGWQVIRDQKRMDYCDIPDKSIIVNVGVIPGRDCNAHSQIQVSATRRTWQLGPQLVKQLVKQGKEVPGWGVNELIAPGGEPIWLTDNDVQNIDVFWRKPLAMAAFYVSAPWSGAYLGLEVAHEHAVPILGSIRIEPASPGRLALPESATQLVLEYPGRDRELFTDPRIVEQVLDQLRGLDRQVGTGELPCTSARPLLASWVPVASEMINLVFADASGVGLANVAVSRDTGCAFATSAHGGRVWLPDGFALWLLQLLNKGQAK